MTERYWESLQPGSGRRAPRADAVGDARVIRLDGQWAFRLSPTGEGTGAGFAEVDFDDSGWDRMRVPSHWVLEPFTPLAGGPARSMRGTDEGPLYTNTAMPIPLDPPRVPTENPTGDYRVVFDVPDDWEGAVVRFQGVDSCAAVWLNGHELGHSKGSRLPFEFDAPVVAGRNVLAVRVQRWSSGTYLEDQDMWWLPGIFREVELIERRTDSIDDHTVHAGYDHTSGLGTLRVESTVPGVVEIAELGLRIATGEEVRMPVEPWSAETPRLYRGTLTAPGETLELAVGFRTVEVDAGVLTVNGRPVKFRGVNRHEHDPDRGRALDVDTMRRDILMMKRANIDAVRTSHYPPHPEFLRLCDEYGLWVVEEVDLETHGFIYADWQGNPPAEAEWLPAMLDRVQRTVERDKNHPSIVVWSLANESGSGENFGEMRAWIASRDVSRPVLYERDPSYRDSDFHSLMYPSLDALEAIGRREEPRPDGISDEHDARRRTLPFLLCEYAHAMGNGPGSLGEYRDILERYDRFCGGFVWEWIDHGFRHTTPDGVEFMMHGGDVAFRPSGGRYCLDGLVTADRVAGPGLAALAASFAPVAIEVAERITVRNKHDHRDTAHLSYAWRLEADGVLVDEGSLEVPVLAAGESAVVPSPAVGSREPGEHWLTVTAVLAAETPWGPPGHPVASGQGMSASHPRAYSSSAQRGSGAEGLTVGDAVFDPRTGRLVALGALSLDGPTLDVWRAPTENDRGQGPRNTMAASWKAAGLDRMLHRTDSVEQLDGSLVVTGRTAPATRDIGIRWRFVWSAVDKGVRLDVEAVPEGIWRSAPIGDHDLWLPRIGTRFSLPATYESATWFGLGPGESYVDSREGVRVGRFHSTIDGLQVPYEVPEENGNHVETRWLELAGADVPTLRVDGDPHLDFTARRWTTEDLELARHPHDLADSGRVWLNLDARQQGLGSASCGPALPLRYRVEPEPHRWSMTLRV